jgi:hypothetical protein
MPWKPSMPDTYRTRYTLLYVICIQRRSAINFFKSSCLILCKGVHVRRMNLPYRWPGIHLITLTNRKTRTMTADRIIIGFTISLGLVLLLQLRRNEPIEVPSAHEASNSLLLVRLILPMSIFMYSVTTWLQLRNSKLRSLMVTSIAIRLMQSASPYNVE